MDRGIFAQDSDMNVVKYYLIYRHLHRLVKYMEDFANIVLDCDFYEECDVDCMEMGYKIANQSAMIMKDVECLKNEICNGNTSLGQIHGDLMKICMSVVEAQKLCRKVYVNCSEYIPNTRFHRAYEWCEHPYCEILMEDVNEGYGVAYLYDRRVLEVEEGIKSDEELIRYIMKKCPRVGYFLEGFK